MAFTKVAVLEAPSPVVQIIALDRPLRVFDCSCMFGPVYSFVILPVENVTEFDSLWNLHLFVEVWVVH